MKLNYEQSYSVAGEEHFGDFTHIQIRSNKAMGKSIKNPET